MKIRHEIGDSPWTLLDRSKYALDLDACGEAAGDVREALTGTQRECGRQLVRYVFAWFFTSW